MKQLFTLIALLALALPASGQTIKRQFGTTNDPTTLTNIILDIASMVGGATNGIEKFNGSGTNTTLRNFSGVGSNYLTGTTYFGGGNVPRFTNGFVAFDSIEMVQGDIIMIDPGGEFIGTFRGNGLFITNAPYIEKLNGSGTNTTLHGLTIPSNNIISFTSRMIRIGNSNLEDAPYNVDLDAIGIGEANLQNFTNGNDNIAIGFQNLRDALTGDNNVALGFRNLLNPTNSLGNIVLGNANFSSGHNLTNNVGIGEGNLQGTVTGYGNVGIGYFTGAGVTGGNGNVFLGTRVNTPWPGVNNGVLNIGNLIFGTNLYFSTTANSAAPSGGRVGINTTNLTATLSVGGTFDATGLITGNGGGISNAVDIIAGSNVTVTTNANGRAFTIASTGGGSGDTNGISYVDGSILMPAISVGRDAGDNHLLTAWWTNNVRALVFTNSMGGDAAIYFRYPNGFIPFYMREGGEFSLDGETGFTLHAGSVLAIQAGLNTRTLNNTNGTTVLDFSGDDVTTDSLIATTATFASAIGNGNGLTNVPSTSYVSATNTFGGTVVDYFKTEVTTNLAGNLTFTGISNFNPTNINRWIMIAQGDGANRTIDTPADWSRSRSAHVVTNGQWSEIMVTAQIGVFTNMTQHDYPVR